MIKCTRCRYACTQSEWVDVPSKKFANATEGACPRCGCRSFFDMAPQVLWIFRDGLVQMGERMHHEPDSGPLLIAAGPRCELELIMGMMAQRVFERDGWLVPNVGQAQAVREKLLAVDAWLNKCQARAKAGRIKGVVFYTSDAVMPQEPSVGMMLCDEV